VIENIAVRFDRDCVTSRREHDLRIDVDLVGDGNPVKHIERRGHAGNSHRGRIVDPAHRDLVLTGKLIHVGNVAASDGRNFTLLVSRVDEGLDRARSLKGAVGEHAVDLLAELLNQGRHHGLAGGGEAMKILVLLRMSPDPEDALELKADGSALDREWMDLKLNDFDDHALEEAVLLKEATAGSVIAVAIGAGAQRTLQMAIARGATSAIAIEWPEEKMILTPAIAPTVAGLARDHAVDLVMTGVQTSEDILGQAAPFIGGLLGWPHVSGTSRIASEGPGKLVVAQERGGGFVANYRITTPAVLGVQTASSPPRYASGTKLREAAQAPIESVPLGEAGPMLPIVALEPIKEGSAETLGATPKAAAETLVRILKDRGLIRGAA
jgi:electron transfer flavoprotein beta subunit